MKTWGRPNFHKAQQNCISTSSSPHRLHEWLTVEHCEPFFINNQNSENNFLRGHTHGICFRWELVESHYQGRSGNHVWRLYPVEVVGCAYDANGIFEKHESEEQDCADSCRPVCPFCCYSVIFHPLFFRTFFQGIHRDPATFPRLEPDKQYRRQTQDRAECPDRCRGDSPN